MNDLIEQLLDYLRGIWRNRWYAMGCAWLVCVVGWVVVLKLPDQYESSARVFVNTQTMLRPLLKGLAVETDPDEHILLITRTLFSRPNLEEVLYLSGLSDKATSSVTMDALLNKLQQQIQLSGPGRTPKMGVFDNLYNITFMDHDPKKAKDVVRALLNVFEKKLTQRHEDTKSAREFLDEQISAYQDRLREAENRLKEFKLKNAGRMPLEGQTYNARLQQMATEFSTVQLELTQAENRRDSLRRQISDALQQQLTGDRGVIVLPIDQRIQSLENNLDELLIKFTEKHPDVNILRQTIADLKKQREQERSQYVSSLAESGGGTTQNYGANTVYQQLKVRLAEEEANIASLQVRVAEYTRRYRELQTQANTLPQIEADMAALNRDYEVNRQQYEQLLARRESAKLSQEADQTNLEVLFKVVDPPGVRWVGPNRLLLIVLVLGASVCAGVALAFLIAQLGPTFDSRKKLTQITAMPVFGSVGMIMSQTALYQERRLLIAYISFGGLLLLGFAALVIVKMMGLS